MENLTRLHNYLLKVINKETLEYLSSINYVFPVAKIEETNESENFKNEETEILDLIFINL